MNKIAAFNWKMNPDSPKEARRLFDVYCNLLKKIKNRRLKFEVVICPPFIYLMKLKNLRAQKRKNLKLGAQDTFWGNSGAYTGEISPKMLKSLGVEYVIIGHSERRKYLNETDEMINKKVLAALKTGLKVILCVGESLLVRRRGKKAVEKFIKSQLKKGLKGIQNSKFKIQNSLITAYEPVWAIGTGRPCRPKDALGMIKFIKNLLAASYSLNSVRVLYGGSVDGNNARDFVKHRETDGVLVGGASLKKGEIKKIISVIGR